MKVLVDNFKNKHMVWKGFYSITSKQAIVLCTRKVGNQLEMKLTPLEEDTVSPVNPYQFLLLFLSCKIYN